MGRFCKFLMGLYRINRWYCRRWGKCFRIQHIHYFNADLETEKLQRRAGLIDPGSNVVGWKRAVRLPFLGPEDDPDSWLEIVGGFDTRAVAIVEPSVEENCMVIRLDAYRRAA